MAACLALGACADETTVSRGFSGGAAVAEVRVASRPPLSLPPDFTRRPERAGAEGAVEPGPGTLSGQPGMGPSSAGPSSAGQSALLSSAGPAAPADIRVRVNEDSRIEMANHALTDELLGWRRPADQPRMIDNKSSKGLLRRLF